MARSSMGRASCSLEDERGCESAADEVAGVLVGGGVVFAACGGVFAGAAFLVAGVVVLAAHASSEVVVGRGWDGVLSALSSGGVGVVRCLPAGWRSMAAVRAAVRRSRPPRARVMNRASWAVV
ncbi:hypothetical protein CYJ93_00765 [Micrococcus luteus]|nr:hypothetical protein CYJ93_00765 [Micrococcus luteus]